MKTQSFDGFDILVAFFINFTNNESSIGLHESSGSYTLIPMTTI
jgi:hypothetical protein